MVAINRATPLKVLLAVDDSPHSAAATNMLTHIIWPAGTMVHLLALVPDRLPLMEERQATLSEMDEAREIRRWRDWAEATAVTNQTATHLRAHELEVKTKVGEGSPSQLLLERAADLGAELVVIGARSYSSTSRCRLGSAAANLANRADSSVLIVRPSAQVRPLNTIIAVDNSPEAWQAVEFLCALALPQWARISAVTIVEEALSEPVAVGFSRPIADRPVRPNISNRIIAHLHECGIQVRPLVRAGHPADEILASAREQETDLIVLGAGSQPQQLGHVAEKIVNQASCSVLVARPRQNDRTADK